MKKLLVSALMSALIFSNGYSTLNSSEKISNTKKCVDYSHSRYNYSKRDFVLEMLVGLELGEVYASLKNGIVTFQGKLSRDDFERRRMHYGFFYDEIEADADFNEDGTTTYEELLLELDHAVKMRNPLHE